MNPNVGMNPDENASTPDPRATLARIDAARERYNALNHQINDLFAEYGTSAKMPPEAVARYRDLQRRRDDAHNEVAALESQFFPNDDVI